MPQKFSGAETPPQCANRNRRGIRRQDCARFAGGFHLGKYGFLNFFVFNNGLDNNVYFAKVSIRERRSNTPKGLSKLGGIDFLSFELLPQKFIRFRQSKVERGFVDILHDDGDLFARGLVGNTTPHDACAQDGCSFHIGGNFAVAFVLLFDELVV